MSVELSYIMDSNRVSRGRGVMKRTIWVALLLVLLLSVSTVWFFVGRSTPPSLTGFRITTIGTNVTLISDADILSYNWTSQEMAITPQASARLNATKGLYNWTGFVITIDGGVAYGGVFRAYTMSAIPAPPAISILFPSVTFPSQSTNYGAMRMFYPGFQPPGDQSASNVKLIQHFQKTNRLTY
jgi:hypothetical protein